MIKCQLIALIPGLLGMTLGAVALLEAPPSAAENSAPLTETQAAETQAAHGSEPQTADAPATDKKIVKPADTLTSNVKVFEGFMPSETISADNAVPFPVDI